MSGRHVVDIRERPGFSGPMRRRKPPAQMICDQPADEIAFGERARVRTRRRDRRGRSGCRRRPRGRPRGRRRPSSADSRSLRSARSGRAAAARRTTTCRARARCLARRRRRSRSQTADVHVVEVGGAPPPDADQCRGVGDRVAASGRPLERCAIADVAVDERAGQAAARRAAREHDQLVAARASARTTARPRYPVPPVTSTFTAAGSASSRAGRRASARSESRRPAELVAQRARDRRGAAACRSGGSVPDRRLIVIGTRARDSRRRADRRIAIARPEQTLYGRPGDAPLDDEPVGAHRVAHVGEIAARVEVADRDLRRPHAALDVGDPPREARRGEMRVLPRAEVVERPRDRDGDASVRPCRRASPARACSTRTGSTARAGRPP